MDSGMWVTELGMWVTGYELSTRNDGGEGKAKEGLFLWPGLHDIGSLYITLHTYVYTG